MGNIIETSVFENMKKYKQDLYYDYKHLNKKRKKKIKKIAQVKRSNWIFYSDLINNSLACAIKKGEKVMKYWLQSLQENAFDVFIVTIVIISIIAYHYLQRWFINKKFDKMESMLLEIFDEVEKWWL